MGTVSMNHLATFTMYKYWMFRSMPFPINNLFRRKNRANCINPKEIKRGIDNFDTLGENVATFYYF